MGYLMLLMMPVLIGGLIVWIVLTIRHANRWDEGAASPRAMDTGRRVLYITPNIGAIALLSCGACFVSLSAY